MTGLHCDADTIFAVASGAGKAAVTLLRISGQHSSAFLGLLCGKLPEPRRASLRALRIKGALLDRAVVLWLPGPGSYTGEDSGELYLHGGRAVLAAVSEALVILGARPAEAGEFTRRAFLNGRMDLIEAEGIADLIAAETEAQRIQALQQMDGALGTIYHNWAGRLLHVLAQLEALIDFPDENLPPEVLKLGGNEIAALVTEIRMHLNDGRRGELLREGLVFAVTGLPNVGKSTLVNALAQREVSIVTALPGTTRDVLEVRVVFGGIPVTLLDTAGLRKAADPAEAEGVRRALARAEAADVVIAVNDGTSGGNTLAIGLTTVVNVQTKTDLGLPQQLDSVGVSVLTGAGMATLSTRLADLAQLLTATSGPPALTRARHRAALSEAVKSLEQASAGDLPELQAENVRLSLRAFGRVTGSIGVEDVLDSVFSQFCIGK